MRFIMSIVLFFALAASSAAEDADYRTLAWDDLMPAGEWERIEKMRQDFFAGMGGGSLFEGGPGDQAIQFGTYNVVEDLNNQSVSLPGFVLPFEYTEGKKVSQFLLVPYFGACLHSPPPPPNQIVYVTTDKPIAVDSLWAPIWARGTLVTEKNLNGLGDAAYTLRLDEWETYEQGG